MQLVEQIGSGIMRMNDLMKEAGLPLPEFTTEGMFTIRLQRGTETVEKSVEEIIVKLIEAKSNTTTKEMMIATGL